MSLEDMINICEQRIEKKEAALERKRQLEHSLGDTEIRIKRACEELTSIENDQTGAAFGSGPVERQHSGVHFAFRGVFGGKQGQNDSVFQSAFANLTRGKKVFKFHLSPAWVSVWYRSRGCFSKNPDRLPPLFWERHQILPMPSNKGKPAIDNPKRLFSGCIPIV